MTSGPAALQKRCVRLKRQRRERAVAALWLWRALSLEDARPALPVRRESPQALHAKVALALVVSLVLTLIWTALAL